MADVKRQSGGGRPGQPKTTATAPAAMDDIMSKAIGSRVRFTTSTPANNTIEGTIFTACRTTNLLAINTASTSTSTSSTTTSSTTTPQLGDYQLIPFGRIQDIKLISPAPTQSRTNGTTSSSSFETLQPSISRIDTKALKAREEAAIRKMKEHDATRGKGVTVYGQNMFDALSRTLPVRWHGKSIVVLDRVIMTEPYGPENCSAPKTEQATLVRVKKVVEYEAKKMENEKRATVAMPLEAPRKGG